MFILGSDLCLSGGFELGVGNLGDLLDVDEPDDLVDPLDIDDLAAPLNIADLDAPLDIDDLAAPIDLSKIILFSLALFMAAVSVSSIVGLLILADPPYFYLSISSIVGAASYVLVSICLLYSDL
ncbi:hypothetical protein [Candidatus Ichthyocystis sparus]|uniref:hypothetical protein n=1 Tax=Candidatus Ichthyocystis sparus TaxID=1561004 RepID=UPI000B815A38|nr:hypothetical protein [Candidatus Ichthyocystis sparus]